MLLKIFAEPGRHNEYYDVSNYTFIQKFQDFDKLTQQGDLNDKSASLKQTLDTYPYIYWAQVSVGGKDVFMQPGRELEGLQRVSSL